MRKNAGIYIVFYAFVLISCQEAAAPSEFTGNEIVYTLQSGSVHGLNGIALFQEKKDKSTVVTITLNKIKGDTYFPTHLHFGDLSESGAEIAAILNPVASNSGMSKTTVLRLADETRVTYKDMMGMAACIKVHLSDIGPEKDIVIAGGNVGASSANTQYGKEFGICKNR